MDHHFVPRSYLRQWCGDDNILIRYRRVGPPGARKLVPDKKTPEGICWEQDLYRIPGGGIANGLTDHGVEHLLARTVDESIPPVVKALGDRTGLLEPEVGNKVRWIMQNFIARDPDAIARARQGVAESVAKHRAWLEGAISRAATAEMKAELSQYRDPRMPSVFTLANLAGMLEKRHVPIPGWLEGRVCALNAKDAKDFLKALGMTGFPTYDRPVVDWEENEEGLVASMSMSPDIVVFVINGRGADPWELARRHVVCPLPHRKSAICRREEADGFWVEQLQSLKPWS